MVVHLLLAHDALRIALEARGASVRTGSVRDAEVVVLDDLALARTLRAEHPGLAIVLVASEPPPSDLAVEHAERSALDPASLAARLEDLVARRRAVQFTSELAALRAGFAARLPARLAELGAAITAGRTDPQHLTTARVLAHRLGGSSGSYGHVALGATLEAIERELDAGATGRLDELMATAYAQLPRDSELAPGSSATA